MKRKLLFLAVALLCSVTLWADVVPTVSTPVEGNSYYLYNPKTNSFLFSANGTSYTRGIGHPWLIEVSDLSGFVKLRLKDDETGYFWGKYWSLVGANYSSYPNETYFRLDKKAGTDNDYQIYANAWNGTAGAYVYVNAGNSNRVACNAQEQNGLDEDYTIWQFVSESDYATYSNATNYNYTYTFSDIASATYTDKGSEPTGGHTYVLYNETGKFLYNDSNTPKISSTKATFYSLETTADMFYISSDAGFMIKSSSNNWTTTANGSRGDYAKWKMTYSDGNSTIHNYKRGANTHFFAPNSNGEDVTCYSDKTTLKNWYFIDVTNKNLAVSLLYTLQQAKTTYYTTAEDGAAKNALNTALNNVYAKYVTKTGFTSDTYNSGDLEIKVAVLSFLKATIDDLYLNNSTYVNVVGTERTNLTAAKTVTAAAETVSAYETAIAAVQDAIDTFIAAKTNYDALVVEIDKAKALGIADATADSYAANASFTAATALTSTQNLKVDEYNLVNTTYKYGVELGTWTTKGPTGSLTNQHWSDETRTYLEQSSAAWGQSAWTIKYDQDITLPAGNYVFKVAGRQADSDGVTLSLTVKKGDTIIGTVSDFPKGDTGLGINTSGATDFTTGEGHTYANSGNGRGWEWRYVKFTLAEGATVNVAVDAVATESHMWVSFCDATVQTDNEANISLIAYNIALNDAITARDNDLYNNIAVGTTERDELIAAINADGTLDKTSKDAIDAAKDVLVAKTTAFTAAKSAYDTWTTAKGVVYVDNLSYASDAKFAAIATAQGVTPTTAEEATEAANAVISAYRAYVESNSLAEGISGSVIIDNLIVNPDFATNADGWTLLGDGGSLGRKSAEPLTAANGATYAYMDANNDDNNSRGISQSINLPAGKYLFSVSSRGDTRIKKFRLEVGNQYTEMTRYGNSGQAFGRGWNDYVLEYVQLSDGPVTLKVRSYDNGGGDENKSPGWWSATRFRLVKLPTPDVAINEDVAYTPEAQDIANVTLTRTIKAGYNTLVLPFDLTQAEVETAFGAGSVVYTVDDAQSTSNSIYFATQSGITANSPVLLKATAASTSDYVFNNVTVKSGTPTLAGTNVSFIGSYAATTPITEDANNYIISGGKLYLVDSDGIFVKGTRAYFNVPSASAAKMIGVSFEDGETTSIEELMNSNGNILKGEVYDLQGRRVATPTRGLYIIGGKKVFIK